ncbi:MAG TPA: HAD-IC family P-type ATPase [Polyangiales bacterium]|nr:HAD-IC family P-type ATPase [Polyangiales bacterium]
MSGAFAQPAEAVVRELRSDAELGLTAEEAASRLARCGPNALPEAATRSLAALFVSQFKSPLIYLLFVASGIALALGHVSDAVVILVVVLLNSTIGAVQEGRAERSLRALRKLARRRARVLRSGEQCMVEASAVVPGDVLLLEAGDAVAADARVIEGAALQLAEAALTGESLPVPKDSRPVAEDTLLADRQSMVYAGTYVTAGRARALVAATGAATEIGRIATLAQGVEQPQTPLERRIARFGRAILLAAAPIFALIVGIGLLRDVALEEILLVGISQLVGMIPEGLPVAMTIALAAGVQRMAKRKAIVRRLGAVETLGSTTVICSDKTGTLTRNEMTVTDIYLADGRALSVSGVGYAPDGEIFEQGRACEPLRDAALRGLLEAVVLCNDARLSAPHGSSTLWQAIGDPTEVALLTLAGKAGLDRERVRARWPRSAELPFDPADKLMATEHGSRVIVKGAPEVLLELCGAVRAAAGDLPLDTAARATLRAAAHAMGERALRVLAVGVVDGCAIDARTRFEAFRGRITLLGLVGQMDPPRVEVKAAVARCRQAGIKPVVITGDHKATGYAVARALDIAREGDVALDGRELEQLSDDQLAARLPRIAVFARVHPVQKLRIVSAYQRLGHVVAMTGDGVNDAPALVQADVGVAMGLSGTDVAKEAAKVVISDDNFASIVAAVEEGRVVYGNIRKSLLLLVSTSLAEAAVMVLAMTFGYPPPFAAVQILWNNLVTEGLITVNLVMERAEGHEMQRAPLAPDAPLLDRTLLLRTVLMACTIAAATLGWFMLRTASGVPPAEVRTETFMLLVICEWFNVLNCRSASRSGLTLGVLTNRWLLAGLGLGNLLQIAVVYYRPLGELFHTTPIGLHIALALGLVGSLVLWPEELRKLIVRHRASRLDRVLHCTRP